MWTQCACCTFLDVFSLIIFAVFRRRERKYKFFQHFDGKTRLPKKKIMNEEVLKSKLGCENQQNSLNTSGNEVIIILADILFSPLHTNNVMLQQIGQFR